MHEPLKMTLHIKYGMGFYMGSYPRRQLGRSTHSLGPGSLVGSRAKKSRQAKRARQVLGTDTRTSPLPAQLAMSLIFFTLFPTKEPGPRLLYSWLTPDRWRSANLKRLIR